VAPPAAIEQRGFNLSDKKVAAITLDSISLTSSLFRRRRRLNGTITLDEIGN
jgi:hypothetical protein